MKKYITKFMIVCACLLQTVNANASVFSLWENEDEEYKMKVGSKETTKKTEKTPLKTSTPTLKSSLQETVVMPSQVNNTIALPNYYTSNNNDNYNMIDYDTIQAERSIQDSEVLNSIDKWQLGIKNVFWENYRGNNIRIEMLRNNRDLKEMRLKFVQSQDMIADPDGSISDMLNKVAEQVMKRTCGKKSKQSIILYERPSIELVKETTYDNYKIIAKGTSLKEYGFRCIY